MRRVDGPECPAFCLRLPEQLREMPAEEVARQLALGGHLEGTPAPPLVAEALEGLEAEEQSFQDDELSSEEANPT
jgi:hypothetical protein